MANPLIDFVERLRRAEAENRFDWQPTIEPPTYYDRRLKLCPAPELAPPVGSIEDARQAIRDAIGEYLAVEYPVEILLIKAMPGVGKTTAAVEAVDALAAAGMRIAYAGPRHDLYRDVVAKSGSPEQWYEWLPRQAEDPETGKIQTCDWAEQMNEWLNRGHEAMDFCEGICGWDYVKKKCVYHAQKGRTERAIFIQHQHVTIAHPLNFDVVFGDESPLSAFLREWRIPAKWVLPPGMDPAEPLTEVLSCLASAAGQTRRSLEGSALMEALGGAQYVREACEAYKMPIGKVMSDQVIHRAEEAASKPYFHLPELLPLLAREAKLAEQGVDYPHRIIISPGFITLLLRRRPDWEKLPPHVIWLDATGKPQIYQALFGRPMKVVDARPRLKGNIYQIVDRANGKQALLGTKDSETSDGKEAVSKINATAQRYRGQSRTLIQRIIKDYQYRRPSVITYKDLVDLLELEEVRFSHFNAARGTNAHEDADAMFILGTPQPNIYDVVKMAKMIFFERDHAFRVDWCIQDRPYAYTGEDGQGRCYPVSGFWQDPDLQTILEALREDEILQDAHRSRPVNHPVDIWLITNVPIEGLPPNELLTMRDVMGAPEGVDIFKWERVQRLMDERKTIVIADLVGLGLSYETANRYMDIIETMEGWQRSVTKSRHGKPTRQVVRSIIADRF